MAAPKAGTTAVHSYLLFHPQVRAPLDKEGRYFDDTGRFENLKRGIFLPSAYVSLEENARLVNIDATPTYLEEIMACQRIAHLVPESSKFVAILRHPVKRLWSWHLMQRRKLYFRRRHTVDYMTPLQFDSVIKCAYDRECEIGDLPIRFTADGDIGTFKEPIKLLITYLRNSTVNHQETIRPCLKNIAALSLCIEPQGLMSDFIPNSFELSADGTLNYDRYLFGVWERALSNKERLAARETCLKCPVKDLAHAGVVNYHNVNQCVGCRCQCYIDLYVLQKSAYRIQIDNCFAHLNRTRFLFVDYEEMIQDYAGTMSRIVAHAGLEPFDFSKITPSMAKDKFEAIYPKFKVATGWQHDLAPEWFNRARIPSKLERDMNRYYASDTEYLRSVTGLPLRGWDADI